MKYASRCLLLGTVLTVCVAQAQPGPRPPGPGPGPASNPTTSPASSVSLPHVVGTLSSFGTTRITVQREMGSGGPTANMDFRVDTSSVVSQGLKSRDRVLVVYEMAKGEGYRAIAVVRCPEGTDPQTLMKSLPKPKT